MSDVQEASLLDQLKMQRAQFEAQKKMAENNMNQLIGAIYACDMMIKKHEDESCKQSVGGQGNGEALSEQTEQAA